MRNSYALQSLENTIRPGQNDFVWIPGQQAKSNAFYPVIAVHGSGQQNGFAYLPNFGSVSLVANLVLQNGSTAFASENDDQAWGNNQALTDIDLQVAYMHNTYGFPVKVILVGGSMGGYTALRYAMTRPANVAAVVGLIPLTDLNWFYHYWGNSGSSPSVANQVASAWNVTAPANIPDLVTHAGSNAVTSPGGHFNNTMTGQVLWCTGAIPINTGFTYTNSTAGVINNAASANSTNSAAAILYNLPAIADIQSVANTLTVPTKFYYSGTDALVNPAQQVAFAANANANNGIPAINVGANGHSEQTILDAQNYNGVRAFDIIKFMTAHGG